MLVERHGIHCRAVRGDGELAESADIVPATRSVPHRVYAFPPGAIQRANCVPAYGCTRRVQRGGAMWLKSPADGHLKSFNLECHTTVLSGNPRAHAGPLALRCAGSPSASRSRLEGACLCNMDEQRVRAAVRVRASRCSNQNRSSCRLQPRARRALCTFEQRVARRARCSRNVS